MLHRIALIIAFLAAPIFAESQVVSGNYRFTVITPNLIRIEHSPAKKFLDEPTYFAVDRKARFDAKILKEPQRVVIDTGVIELKCEDIGGPPMPLSATIRHNGKTYDWKPGQKQTGNLGGTIQTLDQVTGPVPLGEGVLSRDGWYLLDDSDRHVLKDNWIAPREKEEGAFDWYLFGYGRDYKAALKSLTAISGPVPMPRKYALGAWYSRYWPYTSADYRQIVKEYHDNGFPLDVIVLDMDWHITDVPKEQGGGWTGFSWDRKLLPDAEELLKWFKEQNLAVTLNLHPMEGIHKHDTAFEPFMKELGLDPAKDAPPKFDIGDRKYVEAFFKHGHNPLEDAGVDFWWMDWQQDGDMPFVPSVAGLRHMPWLNQLYFQQSQRKGLRGLSFSRWGGWGDHRHPIHFSGDAGTNWESLAFQIPFTSTAGNVGCFFWSHDIGGHMGARNEESYARWCQFGALSAALRSHSTRDEKMDRRPWKYEKWATDSMRKSFRLRSELFPYIYSSVAQSCKESIPLIRPMYLEYPEDEEAYRNPQQYMFGDHLLVAPITMPGVGPRKVAWQVVWFPPGEWFNFFTGEKYTGPSTQIVAADIDEFPLFARAGAPIPMQAFKERMTSTSLDPLVIRCFLGSRHSWDAFALYEDDGLSSDDKAAMTRISTRYDLTEYGLTVAPPRGVFNGQAQRRKLVIELKQTDHPDRVGSNHRVSHDFQDVDSSNRIEVPAYSIRDSFDMHMTVRPERAADTSRLHSLRRARDAGFADHDSRTLIASPFHFLAGVALVQRTDSPSGFGGSRWLEVVAPGKSVQEDAVVQLDGDLEVPIRIRADGRVELDGFLQFLPATESIWRPGLSFKIVCTIDNTKVGELENTGAEPTTIWFPAKTFDWVELEITEVSPTTRNAGIAEMAVFREK